MNTHLPVSRSCIFLVLLMSLGCNGAYRRSIQMAQDAADRGDITTAAHAYRNACKASPGDEEACGQALVFARKAADKAAEQARPACEAGQFDLCLDPLLKVQKLISDHPAVTALLEKASLLHAKRCAEWQADGRSNGAVAGLACLQARAHQFPFPHYKSLIAESADRLARRFAELAGVAENQASSGAAAVFWSTAQCLSPGATYEWRAKQARKDFLDSSSIPIIIDLGGVIPAAITGQISNLCPHLASQLPAWAQCTKGGAAPDQQEALGSREALHLNIDAVIQDLQQSVDRKWFTTQIVVGTETKENPDYEPALKRYESAKAALEQAASECSNGKALGLVKCQGCPLPAEKTTPCTQEAADNYRLKAEAHKKAKDHLDKTPKTQKRDITENLPYTEATYTWRSDFYFTIRTNTPGLPPPLRQSGAWSYQDLQRSGNLGARIKEDPLKEPTNEAFASGVLEKLTPRVITAVKQDGEQRGSTRRVQCKALPADWDTSWVQCWAEAMLWESGEAPPTNSFLLLLASSAGIAHPVKCR